MIDLRDSNHVDMISAALRDWLPGQAQMILELANHRITHDTDWAEDDDFATYCEHLAVVARQIAVIHQALSTAQSEPTGNDRIVCPCVSAFRPVASPESTP